MSDPELDTISGACLCGAVRFAGQAAGSVVTACHCRQCRQWSGHVWASFRLSDWTIEGEDKLRWFASSLIADRGFCADCGSSLFWRRHGRAALSVSAGAVENPAGLKLSRHIWVSCKGDYYDIADGLPQEAE